MIDFKNLMAGKIVIFVMLGMFLFSCNSGGSNSPAKYLLLGALCSTTPDAAACMNGALDADSSRNTSSYRSSGSTANLSDSSNNDNKCFSDYGCRMGYKCIKAKYSSSGQCMKPVDKYGMSKPTTSNRRNVGINYDDGDCLYSSDCPIGFRCDRKYKVCVKK